MKRRWEWHTHRTQHALLVVSVLMVLAGILLGGLSVVPVGGEAFIVENSPTEIEGCTVIENPGEYVLTDDIRPDRNGSCIEIADVGEVTLDGAGHTISGVVGDSTIRVENANSATITDITIAGAEDWTAVSIYDSDSVSIVNISITDSHLGGGTIHVERSDTLVVQESTLKNEVGPGIGVINSSTVTIADNHIRGDEMGIELRNVTDTAIHDNNVAATTLNAVAFFHSDNGTVGDNTIIDSDGGIIVWNSTGFEFLDNYLDGHQYGINARSNSSDIVFRGNTVMNSTHCAIDAKGYSHDIVVENNLFDNHSGVEFETGVHNVTIRDNTLLNARGDHYDGSIGVQQGGHSFEIYNNTIINSTKDGIHLTGWDDITYDISVWNNTVVGAENHGIRLVDSTRNISVHGNYLTNNRIDIKDQNPDENIVEDNILDPIQVIGGEIDQKEVMAGEVISVSADIENLASAKLYSNVRFEIDGELVEVTELDVPPRTVSSIEFEHVFESPGEYEVRLNDVEIGTVTVEGLEEPEDDEGEADDEDPPVGDEDANDTDVVASDDDSADDDSDDAPATSDLDDDAPMDDTEEDALPGFGIGGLLVGFGAAVYMVKRRMKSTKE